MLHEKIIKREDGTQVKIEVFIFIEYVGDVVHWNTEIQTKDKGRKKWCNLHPEVDESSIVSEEEIYTAKLELWKNLKPAKKVSHANN